MYAGFLPVTSILAGCCFCIKQLWHLSLGLLRQFPHSNKILLLSKIIFLSMALDFFFYKHNQFSVKGGFSPPHSEMIYIRHLETNMDIFMIFRKFLKASKRNPTTWSRFTVSPHPPPLCLALEPDGT